jgi:SAM-dependent methyltransferase
MAGGSQNPSHWDQRYLQNDVPWDSGIASRELFRVLQDEQIAPGRAFELGCGTGTNAVSLAQRGFDVVAADFSSVAIAGARRLTERQGCDIRFVAADVCCLDALREALGAASEITDRHQFSFLFDRGCYHCVRQERLAEYLATVNWLAAPGARMLILCGNANEQRDHGPPRVTEVEIRREWDRLFAVEWIREFRFEDRGGTPGPLGWSCLLSRRDSSR